MRTLRSLALLLALTLLPTLAFAQAGYLDYGSVTTANPAYSTGTNQPVSLDTIGGLRVNCIEGCSASGNTQANASSSAPTYSAGTNPLSLDLAGSLRVVTKATGPNAAGTIATNSELAAGYFLSSPPTLTTGQQAPLLLDSAGFLKVNVAAGGGAGGTSSSFAAAFPATGTAVGMSQGGNMVAITGTAGNLNVNCQVGCTAASDTSNGPVSPGVAATTSKLAGLQFNTVAPTLTNGQQVAAQADVHGNHLVAVNTALPTGTNVIGQVGGSTVNVEVTPTVTVAAYSAGQCIGGLMTFSNAARTSGPGSALVQSAVVRDVSGQDASLDIVLFKQNPTNSTFTDHSTCTVNSLDLDKLVGVIAVSDCHLLGATAPGLCQGNQQAITLPLGQGNTTAWAVAVSRGTPTYTATSNVGITLGFLQD